jgi:hypothetical protein
MVDRTLAEFVKEALAKGATRIQIERMLVGAGWPQGQAKAALASYAEEPFVVPVPLPRRYVSAREAFLYLVLFILLGVIAGHLGSLLFVVIDIVMPPDVVEAWQMQVAAGTIRWAVSALAVALPLFLLLSWRVGRARRRNPAMQGSRIRKWLTYVTLVVAAGTLIGDLIAVVYNLLSGELTLRFLLKAGVIAVIAGVIFGYYVRDAEHDEDKAPARGLNVALGSALAVVTLAASAFCLGTIDSPAALRAKSRDLARLNAIARIARSVDCYRTYEGAPPESLDAMRAALDARAATTTVEYNCSWNRETDPVTGADYEYRRLTGDSYEVCGVFDRASNAAEGDERRVYTNGQSFSAIHGKGRHCFTLTAKSLAKKGAAPTPAPTPAAPAQDAPATAPSDQDDQAPAPTSPNP